MSGKSVLKHNQYPKDATEYEEELSETEREFQEELQEAKDTSKQQAQRYVLWGAVTVVINISVFYLFYRIFGVEYQIANFIAWVIGVQCSFWLERIFVFKHTSSHAVKEMGQFYGTRVITFLIEAVILWLGISVMGLHGTITKVVGHGTAIVMNYFLSKLFVFKK